MYKMLRCGNMSFSVWDKQSVDESITCKQDVEKEVADELRYHVHGLYSTVTIDRVCVITMLI
jgi:hypothetical protein